MKPVDVLRIKPDAGLRVLLYLTGEDSLTQENLEKVTDSDAFFLSYVKGEIVEEPMVDKRGICARCFDPSDRFVCDSCAEELLEDERAYQERLKKSDEPPSGLFDDQPNPYETEDQEP